MMKTLEFAPTKFEEVFLFVTSRKTFYILGYLSNYILYLNNNITCNYIIQIIVNDYFFQDTDDIVEALKIFGGPKDSQTSPQLKKEMEDIIVDLVSPLNDDNYVDLLAELPVQDESMEASWNIQDVTCR